MKYLIAVLALLMITGCAYHRWQTFQGPYCGPICEAYHDCFDNRDPATGKRVPCEWLDGGPEIKLRFCNRPDAGCVKQSTEDKRIHSGPSTD